jgi:pimeloyl-ACP methyl ester carboxylesterase
MQGKIQHGILIGLACIILVACQQENGEQALATQAFLTHRQDTLDTFDACERNATTALASLVAVSRCSIFQVPENYEAPADRQIDLKVMVIPALNDLPEADPLFLLAGGPGQAASDLVQVAQIFSRVRTDRDIVLVDQRGTGDLSPFDCQMGEEQTQELEALDPEFEEIIELQMQILRDCLQTMQADAEFYTTDIAMRDLDAVLQYLGYSQLNLWGASYGSRAALAYLQAYPEFTRAVIIDAIAPPVITLPVYNERDASASLQKILDDCAGNDVCNAAYPELSDHYQQLIERLAIPQQLTVIDDSDFSSIETTLADYEFLGVLRQVLYSREAQRLIPLIIEQAWQGNFKPVFALNSQYSEAQINQGMFLSVICNEDYTLIDDGLLAAEAGNQYLIESEMFNRFVFEACAIWPKRELDQGYFEAVTEDKPVLIFSGTLDPITPPEWGELVHDALPNSMHFVLEGFAHGTPFTQCTLSMMNNFIEVGNFSELESDCITQFKRRPFFVTPGGSSLTND